MNQSHWWDARQDTIICIKQSLISCSGLGGKSSTSTSVTRNRCDSLCECLGVTRFSPAKTKLHFRYRSRKNGFEKYSEYRGVHSKLNKKFTTVVKLLFR